MTNDELVALVGVITSLIFSYFPVVKDWFEKQAPNVKRLLQVGVAVVASGAVFGLSCAGPLDSFTCDWPGVLVAVRLLGIFLIANQTAYKLSPQ